MVIGHEKTDNGETCGNMGYDTIHSDTIHPGGLRRPSFSPTLEHPSGRRGIQMTEVTR